MIAKLIVHGVDREHARMRMLRALDEFELAGTPTLLGFHKALLSHPCFIAGETCHGIVESEEIAARAGELTRKAPQAESSANGRVRPRARSVEVGGRRYDVTVLEPEPPWAELARRRRERAAHGPAAPAARRSSPRCRDGAQGRGRRGRRDRSRQGGLHRRGDEDGERDRRPPLREGLRAVGRRRGRCLERAGDLPRPGASRSLCAETSLAHAEPLAATASRVDTWILIEYRGLWAHDAVDGSTLSRELKAHLRAER